MLAINMTILCVAVAESLRRSKILVEELLGNERSVLGTDAEVGNDPDFDVASFLEDPTLLGRETDGCVEHLCMSERQRH